MAERGRMGWQEASGYNWRALVEADVSRFNRVVGDGLRSRTNKRRATEVAIAVGVLNRMLDLGRPEYVRVAMKPVQKGVVRPTSAFVQHSFPNLHSRELTSWRPGPSL